MSIIWIRHGTKQYNNSKGPRSLPKHDPPLLLDRIKDIEDKCNILIDKYGRPDIIVSGPYERTRHTAMIFKKMVEERGYKVNIKIDNAIGEYLGNQKPIGEYADISDETSRYIRPVLGEENFIAFQRRVTKCKTKVRDVYKNIWYVTHGIFISTIYGYYMNEKIPKVGELEGFRYIPRTGEVELI